MHGLAPQQPWLLIIPLMLPLLAAVEAWLRVRRGLAYDWKAYWASLADALVRGLINRVLQGGVVGLALYGVARWRVTTLHLDAWWQWLALFFGVELCYYWMHRADHRIRWLWLNHAVHHSPNQYTLASAYRLGWTGQVTGAAVCFAPLVWLGFPVPVVLAAVALNLTYQFWLHTELIGTLPRWVEAVFNTPAHHRVHHASNPQYLDCNYGGVLIVFDRVFGTFRSKLPGVPIRYGLVEPVHSHNPARIALHAWIGMFADLRHVRSLKEGWMTVFGPPGFRPGVPARHEQDVFRPPVPTGMDDKSWRLDEGNGRTPLRVPSGTSKGDQALCGPLSNGVTKPGCPGSGNASPDDARERLAADLLRQCKHEGVTWADQVVLGQGDSPDVLAIQGTDSQQSPGIQSQPAQTGPVMGR